MALATIRWPGPSGIPASLHVPDPAIPAKPPAPHREHVSYVSAQVRGHLRLPAVGKVDDLHFIDPRRKDGLDVSNHLKWLASTPCWPRPAGGGPGWSCHRSRSSPTKAGGTGGGC